MRLLPSQIDKLTNNTTKLTLKCTPKNPDDDFVHYLAITPKTSRRPFFEADSVTEGGLSDERTVFYVDPELHDFNFVDDEGVTTVQLQPKMLIDITGAYNIELLVQNKSLSYNQDINLSETYREVNISHRLNLDVTGERYTVYAVEAKDKRQKEPLQKM